MASPSKHMFQQFIHIDNQETGNIYSPAPHTPESRRRLDSPLSMAWPTNTYAIMRKQAMDYRALVSPEVNRSAVHERPIPSSWFGPDDDRLDDPAFSYLVPPDFVPYRSSPIFHSPHAYHDEEDPIRSLAASLSEPLVNNTRGSESFSSPSTAVSSPNPTDDDEGTAISTEAEMNQRLEDEEDLGVVANPANRVTFLLIHPWQSAAGGEEIAIGLDVRPFPANREALLDLLEEGLNLECLLPSTRRDTGRKTCKIVCLARHILQANGEWEEGPVCSGVPMSSEPNYERHIRDHHLKATRGNFRDWILGHRESVVRLRHNQKLVVQGARRKMKDVPRKDRPSGRGLKGRRR